MTRTRLKVAKGVKEVVLRMLGNTSMIPAGALATLAVLKLSPDQSAGVAHVMIEIEEATAIDVAQRIREEATRSCREWRRTMRSLTHRRRVGVMCDQAG